MKEEQVKEIFKGILQLQLKMIILNLTILSVNL